MICTLLFYLICYGPYLGLLFILFVGKYFSPNSVWIENITNSVKIVKIPDDWFSSNFIFWNCLIKRFLLFAKILFSLKSSYLFCISCNYSLSTSICHKTMYAPNIKKLNHKKCRIVRTMYFCNVSMVFEEVFLLSRCNTF